MTTLVEADVEQAALEWLSGLGWQALHGPDIAPDGPNAERDDYGHRNRRHEFVVMSNHLHAITRTCGPPVGAQSRRCKEGGLCATASHGTQIEIDPIR